jgi:hypothetical protein
LHSVAAPSLSGRVPAPLPWHDVVLAQGLPAESFLDMKDGSNYANRPGPIRLYPGFRRPHVGGVRLRAADRNETGTGDGACAGRTLRGDAGGGLSRRPIAHMPVMSPPQHR